jgi:hypothetical protein
MSKVKLQLVEISNNDSYSGSNMIRVGDIIEFDEMPNFETWPERWGLVISGFDHCDEINGTNLRTGKNNVWVFHAVKFESVK